MKKENTQKVKTILEYDKKKSFEMFFLSLHIDELIKQNKDIPASLLSEYLTFFEIFDPEKSKRDDIESLIQKCYEYLKKCSYDFTVKEVILVPIYNLSQNVDAPVDSKDKLKKKPQRLYIKLTSLDLLEKCFSAVINIEVFERVGMNKKMIIEFIYGQVDGFNNNRLNQKLNQYKVKVITGLIASSLGIIHDSNTYSEIYKTTSGYNKYLFDQVRNNLE
jgi:hypothetical protein